MIERFKKRIGFRFGITICFSLLISNLGAVNITNAQVSSAHVGADLVIQNGGTLTTDGTHSVNSIEVQVGGKLDVTAGNPLTVVTTLLFNADVTTGTYGAKIYADVSLTAGTKSAKFVKNMDDTKWFFLSFPYDVDVADITLSAGLTVIGTDWFIRSYNTVQRSTNGWDPANWTNITAGTLTAGTGYIFGLKNAHVACTLTFPLKTTGTITNETSKTNTIAVDGTNRAAGVIHQGWNLIGVPYLSKFTESGIDQTYINIFNGSSYDQITTASAAVLNPMTAYFVQMVANGNVTFTATSRALVHSAVKNDLTDRVKLSITTSEGSDDTNLIIDPTQSTDYLIGSDLSKFITTGTFRPQLYSSLNGIDYAFNALPLESVINLPLRVYNSTVDSATISADMSAAPGISHLLLTDNTTNITTDLATGNYRYQTAASTETARFVLTAQNVATKTKPIAISNKALLYAFGNKLSVTNITSKTNIRVIDDMGRLIASEKTNNNSVEISLPIKGIYFVQLQSGVNSWTEKIANY